MKLLEKSVINNLKALERKREIDEGKKLAERVDKLRELSSKEQANLSEFRDHTLKAIRQEIDDALFEKEKVLRETEELINEGERLRKVIEKTLQEITNLTTKT